jgi:hypothetical protein
MKCVLLLLMIAILSGCYSKNPEKTGLEGKSMPSFKILLADSSRYVDTKNIPTGRPIVLFYYGPNCPYSRAQIEEMIDNISIMKEIQFLIVTRAPFNQMKSFNAHYQLNRYDNIIAGVDSGSFITDFYKVTGVPFTVIFDKNKKLISAFTGKIYVKQIISAVNP